MTSLTIQNLDAPLEERLRRQAAHHGWSVEEEARQILRLALTEAPQPWRHLAEAIRRRFAPFGAIDLPAVDREPLRDPPRFDE